MLPRETRDSMWLSPEGNAEFQETIEPPKELKNNLNPIFSFSETTKKGVQHGVYSHWFFSNLILYPTSSQIIQTLTLQYLENTLLSFIPYSDYFLLLIAGALLSCTPNCSPWSWTANRSFLMLAVAAPWEVEKTRTEGRVRTDNKLCFPECIIFPTTYISPPIAGLNFSNDTMSKLKTATDWIFVSPWNLYVKI